MHSNNTPFAMWQEKVLLKNSIYIYIYIYIYTFNTLLLQCYWTYMLIILGLSTILGKTFKRLLLCLSQYSFTLLNHLY